MSKNNRVTIVHLSKEHYESLPAPTHPAGVTSAGPALNQHDIRELRLAFVVNQTAKYRHRKNSNASWAHAVMIRLSGDDEKPYELAHEFRIPRQKLYSHKKAFSKRAMCFVAPAQKITEKTVEEFTTSHRFYKTAPEALHEDIAQIRQALLYLPRSRKGEHEVAVDLFLPSPRRRKLLARSSCTAQAADRIGEFIRYIETKGEE